MEVAEYMTEESGVPKARITLFAEFARLEGDKIKEGHRYLGLGAKLIK